MVKETITDILDAIALCLFAAGAAVYMYQWIGLTCLAVAGVVIVLGTAIAARVTGKESDE